MYPRRTTGVPSFMVRALYLTLSVVWKVGLLLSLDQSNFVRISMLDPLSEVVSLPVDISSVSQTMDIVPCTTSDIHITWCTK